MEFLQEKSGAIMTNKLLILGSLAYDSISTPLLTRKRILGGSANYATLAATFYYNHISTLGSVGKDYSKDDMQKLAKRGVDTSHIYTLGEHTAHWEGCYKKDLNQVVTVNEPFFIKTFSEHCNHLTFLLQNQKLQLEPEYKYVFLGNTDPHLQNEVLKQLKTPYLVAYDTRSDWISRRNKKDTILQILKKVDILFINEEEAHLLTQTQNTIETAYKLKELGAKAIVVKKGEHGFLLHYQDKFLILPAFPIRKVIDTTGAGDVFAGGMLGFLLQSLSTQNKPMPFLDIPSQLLAEACLQGNILASYVVEDFGTTILENISLTQIKERVRQYKTMISTKDF